MRYDAHFTMLPERAFRPVGGRMTYEGGGKNSQPAAPDYTGAAQAQGQSSKENMAAQTWANRPQISTPWGTQTWNSNMQIDPATGQEVTGWGTNITLDPAEQQALEGQQGITAGRTGIAQGLMGQVAGSTSQPFDWEGMPKAPGSIGAGSVEDAQSNAFKRMSAALQPGRQQQEAGMHNRLLASGLPEGSEAWNRAGMGLQNQWTQEDKSLLAQSGAEGRADVGANLANQQTQGTFQQGLRTNAIAEEAQKRGMSLNELNALLTGQQVSMPQGMGQQPNTTAGAAAATPFMAAAQGQGQQNLQGGTNWGSALGGIAQVAGAAAPFFSDRRLKKNIVPLGDGWYEFEYIWGGGRRVGVMAQELLQTRPDLVSRHASGYLMVNYAGL